MDAVEGDEKEEVWKLDKEMRGATNRRVRRIKEKKW